MLDTLSSALKGLVGWISNGDSIARLRRLPVWVFIWGVAAVALIETAYVAQYNMIYTIGIQSAPSVESAHGIKAYGALMLKDVALELNGDQSAVKAFDEAEAGFVKNKSDAHENVTFRDNSDGLADGEKRGERDPLERIEKNYDVFLQLVSQARTLYHQNNDQAWVVLDKARGVIEQVGIDADKLATLAEDHDENVPCCFVHTDTISAGHARRGRYHNP